MFHLFAAAADGTMSEKPKKRSPFHSDIAYAILSEYVLFILFFLFCLPSPKTKLQQWPRVFEADGTTRK